MKEIQNPFVPGAGIQPPELTGRDSFIGQATITIERALSNRFGKSFIAVGLRGVGKTVLLNKVKSISTERNCKTLFIEIHENKSLAETLIHPLRKILLDLDALESLSHNVKKALRVLSSFINTLSISYNGMDFGLTINPEAGVADSGDIEVDIPDLFSAIGIAAKESGVAVTIILDEMQYLSEKEMSALVMAMHRASQEQLPMILIGAGLPLLVGKMGKSKSYAERLFDFPEIGALSYEDACLAINAPAKREGAEFDISALHRIYELTQGYPYFLQEWAYVCWNLAPLPLIHISDVERSISEVIQRLDRSFFRVRFDRLTPREKQYLRAMAELGCGPHRSGDIAGKLGVPSNKLGPCRSNLISKGMVYSPSFGDTAFTVPLFDQYMQRAMAFTRWNEVE